MNYLDCLGEHKVKRQTQGAINKDSRNLDRLRKFSSEKKERKKAKDFKSPQKTSADEYFVEDLHVMLMGYSKGDKLVKSGVIDMFDAISKHAAANDYYVGITCDPDRREGEHKSEFLAVIDCPDKDKACELEKTLRREGYDAGGAVGNVHKPNSKKVYIYKK